MPGGRKYVDELQLGDLDLDPVNIADGEALVRSGNKIIGGTAAGSTESFFDRAKADEGSWVPDLSASGLDPQSLGTLKGSTWTKASSTSFLFDDGAEAFLASGTSSGDLAGGIGPAANPVLGTHHWLVSLRCRLVALPDVGFLLRGFLGVTSHTLLASIFGSSDPGGSHIAIQKDSEDNLFWTYRRTSQIRVDSGVRVTDIVGLPLRLEMDWRNITGGVGRQVTVSLYSEVDAILSKPADVLLDSRTFSDVQVPTTQLRPALGVETLSASSRDIGVLESTIRNNRQFPS